MEAITHRQFQIRTDLQTVWDQITGSAGTVPFENGVPAPFFEYAVSSSWLDKRFLDRNRLWFDGDACVGSVFYEDPVSRIFFSVRKGYEFLAGEMMRYADEHMPAGSGSRELVLFPQQTGLIAAAEELGYRLDHSEDIMVLDMTQTELNRPLPEGFRFVHGSDLDPLRLAECTWKGFGHETSIGPFAGWDKDDPEDSWNPWKQYHNILDSMTDPPPHSTHELDLAVEDENGRYACYAGMWWVSENRLAYMEPLCTVPEHRGKGLASAVLSEHCRILRQLGAEYMTGGGMDFYRHIGFDTNISWLFYSRA